MTSKRWKQVAAMSVAFVLLTSALAGCGNKKTVNMAEDGTPMFASLEDSLLEVATVNDTVITVGDLQYYIYNSAMMRLYQEDASFNGDMSNVDWQKKLDSGKTLSETILDDALELAIIDVLLVQKGAEAEITFSDEEKAEMDESVKTFIKTHGNEMFIHSLMAMGIDSKEEYKKMYERMVLVEKTQADIAENLDKYIEDKEVLKKYKSEEKVSVQHVLILTEDSKFENPEETAKEVLAKAKAGEDFAALIEQYNEDPGATKAGYTFGPGEMVEAFEKASFALEFDEISELVRSEFGYHIIKRQVGLPELEMYWKDKADIDIHRNVIEQVSVVDVMNAVTQAQKALEEASKSEPGKTDKGETNNG